MSSAVNRQVLLAARPAGAPKPSDFTLVETAIPEPGPGEVLVRNIYMSVDPYMRGRMNDRRSYAKPWEVGQPADGRAVGEVVKSNDPCSSPRLVSMLGWREYLPPRSRPDAPGRSLPLASYLGVLGVPDHRCTPQLDRHPRRARPLCSARRAPPFPSRPLGKLSAAAWWAPRAPTTSASG